MPRERLPQRVEVRTPAPVASIQSLIAALEGSSSRDDELSVEAGPRTQEFTLVDSEGFPLITVNLVEEGAA